MDRLKVMESSKGSEEVRVIVVESRDSKEVSWVKVV